VVVLLGQTDAAGRLAFVPAAPTLYSVRALAEDGHGTSFEFDSTALASAMPAAIDSGDRSRGVLQIAAGVALILVLFAGLRRIGHTADGGRTRSDPPAPSVR